MRSGADPADRVTLSVMAVTIDAGRIVAIDMIRNPDKLAAAAALLDGDTG